jgi:hypothetical protein
LGAASPTFGALNALHPLRSIRAAVDYDHATEVLDRLAVLDQRTQDQDYLETLVRPYERPHAA